MSRTIISFLLLAWSSLLLHAYPANTEERQFFFDLCEAVKSDNRDWIADRISYPIRAKIENRYKEISNRNLFLEHYEEIINRRVILALWREDPDKLERNWQSVFIGCGEVHWEGVDVGKDETGHLIFEIRIVAINNEEPGFRDEEYEKAHPPSEYDITQD